jgi:pyruvate ferredoxin oxidoreductase gamma subunit
MRGFNCFAGLQQDGIAIINQREGMEVPKLQVKQKAYVVPANEIAMKTIGRPLGNTALLGAFCAATGELEMDALFEAVKQRFSGKALEGNIEAIKQGYDFALKIKQNS